MVLGKLPSAHAATLGDLEKSIVFEQIDWTGYVKYLDSDGQWYWHNDPIKVSFRCTGFFVGTKGEIATAGHCVQSEASEAVPSIHDSIIHAFLVKLSAEKSDPQEFVESWTGRAKANNWVVSGKMFDEKLPIQRVVTVAQPNGIDGAPLKRDRIAEVVGYQTFESGDLALLDLSDLTEPTPPLNIATETPSTGDPITAIGFPGNVFDMVDATTLHASNNKGSVSSKQTRNGTPFIGIDAAVSGGMSGGPTVRETEHGEFEVIGVNSFGNVDSESANFVTDTEKLVSFLKTHNVELSFAAVPEPSWTEAAWLKWAGAVVVALIIIALVVGLIVVSRRGKKQQQWSPYQTQPTSGYGGQFPPQAPAQGPPPSSV